MRHANDSDPLPLEAELSGLPELEAFTRAEDRADALRAVAAVNENPYTWQYWFWTAVLVGSAILAAQLLAFAFKAAGLPRPFPAVFGILGGIAGYMFLYRALHRWGARPLLREWAARDPADTRRE